MPPPDRLGDYTRDQLTQARLIDFARWVSVRALTGAAGPASAAKHFLDRWPRSISAEIVRKSLAPLETQAIDLHGKAAVAAGTTTDATWAAPLIGPKELADSFLSIVRPQEIVGQLSGVRRVPVNTRVPTWTPTSQSTASWVHEGALKPMTAFTFGTGLVTPAKVQVACAVSEELIQLAAPGSETALNEALAVQVIFGVNEEFILPARVAIANERPGSVTSVGTLVATQNDPVKDALAVLTALQAARPTALPALVMDGIAAAALIATGLHRDLRLTGGIAFGAQVIVSPATGKTIAAIDPSALLLSDFGIEFDASRHASLVLNSAPTSPPDATTVYVSMFQTNSVALRAERFVSWKLTDATAVQHTTRA